MNRNRNFDVPTPPQAFLGRQPIVDRDGGLLGYELLYRRAAGDTRAEFQDEDEASLQVLSTLLNHIGAAQVLAGRTAFVNVGPASLADSSALVLLNPRRTVLELSESIRPTTEVLQRLKMLREIGFGVAVSACPPLAALDAWLGVATHLKVDVRRFGDRELEPFVTGLRAFPISLVAEKVETGEQAARCLELGFHALQGYHVARPETMGSVTLGVQRAIAQRAIDLLEIDAGMREVESVFRQDAALCFRLLRYIASSNFGMMIPVESLRHALTLVGQRRLTRWLRLLIATVEEPSPAAAMLNRAAVFRGHLLELVGAEYFDGADCENLYLVGAFSLLPAMLMVPIDEAIRSLSLPEAVADALVMREGRYAALLELAEVYETGSSDRIEALCSRLTISTRILQRAQATANAAANALVPAAMSQ